MSVSIVWLRSDLRLEDNPALVAAAKRGTPILPLYISEEGNELAASSKWLQASLIALDKQFQQLGSRLFLARGKPTTVLEQIVSETGTDSVYWNHGYDAQTRKQDEIIINRLKQLGVDGQTFRGNLLIKPNEVMNRLGNPFKVFTPFWKSLWEQIDTGGNVVVDAPKKLAPPPKDLPTYLQDDVLQTLRKRGTPLHSTWIPGALSAEKTLQGFLDYNIDYYSSGRDKIDHDGTSCLSPYLHFGEISVRQVWSAVAKHMQTVSDDRESCRAFLRQLAWREFAVHLLYHFPKTESTALDPKFNNFPWRKDAELFSLWKTGQTGYPIVDAGMRQLSSEGWIHNRLRMIVASFLVKDLLIPWQAGADWFMQTLFDADIANNTLGWQWVAGCGADAAPYFRIFNPTVQSKKFDPKGDYIKRFVPELSSLPSKFIHEPAKAPDSVLDSAGIKLGKAYPHPILDHVAARERALEAYARIK